MATSSSGKLQQSQRWIGCKSSCRYRLWVIIRLNVPLAKSCLWGSGNERRLAFCPTGKRRRSRGANNVWRLIRTIKSVLGIFSSLLEQCKDQGSGSMQQQMRQQAATNEAAGSSYWSSRQQQKCPDSVVLVTLDTEVKETVNFQSLFSWGESCIDSYLFINLFCWSVHGIVPLHHHTRHYGTSFIIPSRSTTDMNINEGKEILPSILCM